MRFQSMVLLLALALPTWVGAQAIDSDGDGLSDAVESNGVRAADGSMLLDLPAMGANPRHKDLFVEIDYMVADKHTHQPKMEALAKVVAAFASAPVANPDGTTGIRLHLDGGPESVMDPVAGTKWGQRSRANALPHLEAFGSVKPGDEYSFSAMDWAKGANLGENRLGYFHYCLFIHSMTGQGTTSGMARDIPSDDFLVSLGGWHGDVGSVMEQAGTLMHEFGHVLNLGHGGGDHVNDKPNYFSVMNYNFQTRGLRRDGSDGRLDYSLSANVPLDEAALNEGVGVSSAPAGYGTRWKVLRGGEEDERLANQANAPIDWNIDGRIGPALVREDINADKEIGALRGHADWPAIVYNGGSLGASGQVAPRAQTPGLGGLREITREQNEELPTYWGVFVDSSTSAEVAPAGSLVTVNFTVGNYGLNHDTYTLVGHSERGWADFSGVPTRLTLGPDQEATFGVPVRIPATASAGLEDDLGLVATSGADAEILDMDVASVASPAAAPAPGAELMTSGVSGCFIATAAYGSYLDPHVVSLRQFRDQRLLSNAPGRAFVQAYYQNSPAIAEVVARVPALRVAVLAALTPVVFALEQPLLAGLTVLLLVLAVARLRRKKARPTKQAL